MYRPVAFPISSTICLAVASITSARVDGGNTQMIGLSLVPSAWASPVAPSATVTTNTANVSRFTAPPPGVSDYTRPPRRARAATRARTRSASTGFPTIPPALREVPTMNPAARG